MDCDNIAYGSTGEKPLPDQGVPADTHAETAVAQKGDKAKAKPAKAASDEPSNDDAVVLKVDVPNAMRLGPVPADVQQAATDANAVGFIGSFKYGFHTHCGARGSQLSGGQRQRVAIARAVLRKAPILLLDEATSALDSQSEAVVQEALDRVLQEGKAADAAVKRTSILIAHGRKAVRNADRIVVMDKGQLAEQGSHDELMARPNGLYRKLVLAQDDKASASAEVADAKQ
jgi:ABC-type multidrug transport system fused ATPase/permease subunit